MEEAPAAAGAAERVEFTPGGCALIVAGLEFGMVLCCEPAPPSYHCHTPCTFGGGVFSFNIRRKSRRLQKQQLVDLAMEEAAAAGPDFLLLVGGRGSSLESSLFIVIVTPPPPVSSATQDAHQLSF
jgi:hypothetical protein